MPELPEVETTRRGIAPHLLDQIVADLRIRESRLRWPVPAELPALLRGQRILSVERRGKYLLIGLPNGTLLIHLGMSGSLRLAGPDAPIRKHDHVDLLLENGGCLRFHDPRRFGCFLWTADDPGKHPLLAGLGPEPMEGNFDGKYLHDKARGRSTAVKVFLMDSHVVVGVGNIYANEALFRAGIAPRRAVGRISAPHWERLAEAVRAVLRASIEQGGTTLRDFVNERGNPGYFQQTLQVYDRAGQPCRVCGTEIRRARLGQRASYWCSRCQK